MCAPKGGALHVVAQNLSFEVVGCTRSSMLLARDRDPDVLVVIESEARQPCHVFMARDGIQSACTCLHKTKLFIARITWHSLRHG